MNQKKLSIRYVIVPSKKNRQGVCPIRCRMTYSGKRKVFATGYFINPTLWDSKKQICLNNPNLNSKLKILFNRIDRAFLSLQLEKEKFSVEDIFEKLYVKSSSKEENVLEYFKTYLARLEKLIGKEIKQSTYDKFKYIRMHISSFIKFNYKKNDFPLEKLNLQFIEDFDYYLKTEKNQKQVTINKTVQRFKKVIKVAYANGLINSDPFLLYKPKTVKKEIIYLSSIELEKLEKTKLQQVRLSLVRDLFIFCCYTGLGYSEMNRLEEKNLIRGFDGNRWISMKREKTSKDFSIPILPKAEIILEKYSKKKGNTLLPKLSNQKFNSYLKEIADIIGINKRLTHHTARKTFATTVLLYNNVPMEIVSELLGHSSIAVTQAHYGKIVQKKVSEEMIKLREKI